MKGKRTDLADVDCAIARSLHVIGDWWSLLIVREAFKGAQRFGEFQKALGLARNVLSSRLKKLVSLGILQLEPDGEGAARNRYVLTQKGESLHIVLIALWQWGENVCFAPGEMTLAMVDGKNGARLPPLTALAEDGRAIGARDFHLAARVG